MTLRADLTKENQEAEALLDLLGNTGHSIPYLAVFCAGDPDHPHVLADAYTRGDVLKILDQCAAPPKLETAQAR